jgi:hypothetical protein
MESRVTPGKISPLVSGGVTSSFSPNPFKFISEFQAQEKGWKREKVAYYITHLFH